MLVTADVGVELAGGPGRDRWHLLVPISWYGPET